MSETVNEKLTATVRAWKGARDRATKSQVPFHQAWNDFEQFVADVGESPYAGEKRIWIECKDSTTGFVPGNCYWSTDSQFFASYDDCPVATEYLTAGVIDDATAVRLACIDADPEKVTELFCRLNAWLVRRICG